MIELKDIDLYQGSGLLLDSVSLKVHDGWHTGLTGRNGCGKSSLFSLLMGQLAPDKGECNIPERWEVAHMAQETPVLELSALNYVVDGDKELRHLERQLQLAEKQGDDHGIAQLHHKLDAINAYTSESRAARLLDGLGFGHSSIHNSVSSFSGGWRMRLNLAQTLMCRSDMLLLDEPTNHLDLDAILWLENWLKNYKGTLIIISHDREFLDSVASHILHIENKSLDYYKGNYSEFEERRAVRLQQSQAAFTKQQHEIQHIQKFISRFKAKASKAKQAQSRIKALEKLELIAPAHADSPFHFDFRSPKKLVNPLLRISESAVGYDNKTVLGDISLQLGPESRIGLLGPNGAGKSTLIKTLAGTLPMIAGETWRSEHCKTGYFAQHQVDQLDMLATPLIALTRIAPGETEQKLRNYLGGFGFQGDLVNSPAGKFSGGEKARLALALIIWKKPNLLLLDEPTNHLDLEMRHALTLALQSYQGAMVLVSHDRHLLRNTTDTLLLVADGAVDGFTGDLDEYANWLANYKSMQNKALDGGSTEKEVRSDRKTDRKKSAEARARLRPYKQRIEKIEKSLSALQNDLSSIEQLLADPGIYEESSKTPLTKLLKEQGALKQQVEALETEWMVAHDEMENVLNKPED